MLESEGLNRVLPGIQSIEDGVNVYRQFYSTELEEENGILAIHLQL